MKMNKEDIENEAVYIALLKLRITLESSINDLTKSVRIAANGEKIISYQVEKEK